MMREAVSLMGGYGITEDCPGFLGNKWMDAQLEATYEGPEAVQRRQLTLTMTYRVVPGAVPDVDQRDARHRLRTAGNGGLHGGDGDDDVAVDPNYTLGGKDANGNKLYHGQRQGLTFALADALCWLLAARCQILDEQELEKRGGDDAVVAEGLPATVQFFSDLCHVQSARASGEVSRICAELVYGYNRHPAWDAEGHKACFMSDELDDYESFIPGISAVATDVITPSGAHPVKAGPCAGCVGSADFLRLQNKLATCLTGSRLAKDRAAQTMAKVMIPEALDYPA